MVYVFDAQQEMGACCGCPLTPNELINESAIDDLTPYWEINFFPSSGLTVEGVSALPNNPFCINHGPVGGFGNNEQPVLGFSCYFSIDTLIGCDPSAAYEPTQRLGGYISHKRYNNGPRGITEVELIDEGTPDSAELSYLISQCGSNLQNGSGRGACDCHG